MRELALLRPTGVSITLTEQKTKPSRLSLYQFYTGCYKAAEKLNKTTLSIGTYEGDPYSLYESTNLALAWSTNPISNFTGALGTNRTVITITNQGKAGFFRTEQKF